MSRIFRFKKIFLVIFFLLVLFFPVFNVSAQKNDNKDFCAVYFTGVGCPHCAQVDPVVLKNSPGEFENLAVIEYEVYQASGNANLMPGYNKNYYTGLGIPLLVFGENDYLRGDKDILNNFTQKIRDKSNPCPLPSGEKKFFSEIDLNDLPYYPKIWRGDVVLVKEEGGASSQWLHELLKTDEVAELIKEKGEYTSLDDLTVSLSGQELKFDQAVKLDGWIIKWRGEDVPYIAKNSDTSSQEDNQKINTDSGKEGAPEQEMNTDFTWLKIVSLAIVDAVNPCAFAVLILMLTTILTYNPKSRKNIILAGLAFIAAVFVMYLFYGLVIIKFIKVVQAITSVRLWMYKILGGVAIILGLLNIKDFISYKPGSLGTEMPLLLRPKVKKLISGVTSPLGAGVVGIFVTLFLLPCTIGPYIICCGVLSVQNIFQSLPPLLIYNAIFVAPMLIIVLLVYLGLKQVKDVSVWKENNIHKLHLVAGLIMFLLGLAMVLGWA